MKTDCVKDNYEVKEGGTDDDYRGSTILNRWVLRTGLIQCSGRLVGVPAEGSAPCSSGMGGRHRGVGGGEGPAAGLLTTEPPSCPDPANTELNLIFLSVSIVLSHRLILRDQYEISG